MKARTRLPLRLAAAAAITFSIAACGVTAPSHNPGYADLDIPNGAGLHRDTSISIGPRMLRFVARHANEGPEAQAMLEALDGVRVRVYRVDEDTKLSWLQERVTEGAERLKGEDWKPVMRVTEDDSVLHVLVREDDEANLLGLALVSADKEELVFVNLMGRLSPEVLNQIPATIAEATAAEASEEEVEGN